jgi:hypothetical protein
MKTFEFKLYIKTGSNLLNGNSQEFVIGYKLIQAKDYDNANKIFNKLDLPFHHYCTVQIL